MTDIKEATNVQSKVRIEGTCSDAISYALHIRHSVGSGL
jgi:hypothetical protein